MASHLPPEYQDGGLPSCLVKAYQRSKKFNRPSISKADLPHEVFAALCLLVEQTWLVIDGVDELDEPQDAVQQLLRISSSPGHALRLAMLSRSIPNIEKLHAAGDFHRIDVQPWNVERDIRAYIESKSRDLPLDDDYSREIVIEEVAAKSDGMFLWSRLVMEDLASATCLADIKQTLRQCPSGVSGIYDRFLTSLSSQSIPRQRLARDLLRWVCCTFRPLNISELESALSTKISAAHGRTSDDQKVYRSAVTEICHPFLVIDPTLDQLRPVHHSFREYLRGLPASSLGATASRFFVHGEASHADIALRCIKYLKSRSLSEENSSPDGFWTYAMTSWCKHTVLGSYDARLEVEICDVLSTSERRKGWLYWMFFGCSSSPFPFATIFRLEEELQRWAEPSLLQTASINTLGRNDWAMDCLELLMELSGRQHISKRLSTAYFDLMIVARDIARRLTRKSQLNAAVQNLEKRKLEIQESEDKSQMGFLLNLLGILYDQQGMTNLALQAHRTARSIQVQMMGEEADEALWTMNETGRMYRHIGLLEESERIHKQVLERLTMTLPEDHPEIIWTVNTLATTLRKQDRPAEALDLHLQAYNSRSKTLGGLHAHTLWSCADVAKCYRDQQMFATALVWYQKTLEGRITTFGSEHADTLWTKNDVGVVLAALGRHLEAKEIQEEALRGQERVLGMDHKHTCWTRRILEELTSEMGNRSKILLAPARLIY